MKSSLFKSLLFIMAAGLCGCGDGGGKGDAATDGTDDPAGDDVTGDPDATVEADPDAEATDPGPDEAAQDPTTDDVPADPPADESETGVCTSGTVVFSSGFEDGSLEGMWVDGDASISTEEAHAGSSSALYRFSGAGHWGLTDMAPYREFYVEFWAMLVDMPCTGTCDPAGKHFFRFAWWPDKSGGIQKQIDTGMRSGTVDAWWFDFEVPTTGANIDYGDAIQRDVWSRVRVAYRPNTPGSADGRFVWMFDDSAVMDLTDEFFGTGDELDTFMFTNYDFVPSDGISDPRIFVDDLVVITGDGAFECLGIP
jgi:hypothetical protein